MFPSSSLPPQAELRTSMCKMETNIPLQGQMGFGTHPAWVLLFLSLHYTGATILGCVCMHTCMLLPFCVEKCIRDKYVYNSVRDPCVRYGEGEGVCVECMVGLKMDMCAPVCAHRCLSEQYFAESY